MIVLGGTLPSIIRLLRNLIKLVKMKKLAGNNLSIFLEIRLIKFK